MVVGSVDLWTFSWVVDLRIGQRTSQSESDGLSAYQSFCRFDGQSVVVDHQCKFLSLFVCLDLLSFGLSISQLSVQRSDSLTM